MKKIYTFLLDFACLGVFYLYNKRNTKMIYALIPKKLFFFYFIAEQGAHVPKTKGRTKKKTKGTVICFLWFPFQMKFLYYQCFSYIIPWSTFLVQCQWSCVHHKVVLSLPSNRVSTPTWWARGWTMWWPKNQFLTSLRKRRMKRQPLLQLSTNPQPKHTH